MEFNKLVVGALVTGCVAAAGGGAYLAVRDNAADQRQVMAEATLGYEAEWGAGPVAASEGLILPEPAPEPEIREVPAPAPAPRTEVPARTPQAAAAPEPVRRAPARPASSPAAPPRAPAPASEPVATVEPEAGPSMWEARAPVAPARPDRFSEPEASPAPPEPTFVELVIPADSVLGLQIERTLSSEHARVEDRVDARVTRDVRVGNRVAIPAGAIVHGTVTEVDPGGKIKEKARLGVRFHTVVLADGTRLDIRTDTVVREGQSPSGESAAKIGGAAAGGAILGAILGGGRGAAIGGAVGAAGGTAAQMAGGRNPAVLPAGTTVSVRVVQPVTVTVEQ